MFDSAARNAGVAVKFDQSRAAGKAQERIPSHAKSVGAATCSAAVAFISRRHENCLESPLRGNPYALQRLRIAELKQLREHVRMLRLSIVVVQKGVDSIEALVNKVNTCGVLIYRQRADGAAIHQATR